jgi:hypothetical protein
MDVGLENVMKSGSRVKTTRYVVEEDDEQEEEEDVLPLVWRERRSKARSNTLSLGAATKMVDIRGWSMSAVDGILKEAIPEELLLELPNINVIDVHIDCPDRVSFASLLARPEVSLPVS